LERSFIDAVPALAWSALPDGSLDFFNQRFQDYTGTSPDELYGSKWKSTVHRDDIQQLENWWQDLRQTQEAGTTEVRLRRFDGSHRWFLIFANPLRDESGNIVRWYGTNIDIDDRKRAEETLRAREMSWRQIVDNIPGLVATMGATGEVEFLNRQTLEYFGKTSEQLKDWALTDVVHPDDLPSIIEARIKSVEEGRIYEVEHRCRRADGVYRWFQVRGLPVRNGEDAITAWYLLLTDIDDLKRAEQKLKQSEAFLAEGQRLSRTGSFSWCLETDEITWSEQLYRIFEFDDRQPVTLERIASRVYPDDLPLLQDMIERARHAARDFEYQHRLLMPDQSVKHVHLFAHATRDKDGRLEYVGAVQDVTDLLTITDAIPIGISVLAPDGATLYVNRMALDRTGLTLEEVKGKGHLERTCHPDDLDRVLDERRIGLSKGARFALEMRLLPKDGEYRWHVSQYNPLKNESGKIIRWYVTATDIDDRKRAEEKLRRSEQELRTITDTIRQPIVALAPDGSTLYANRVALDLTGLAIDELDKKGLLARSFHPGDVDRLSAERQQGLSSGAPFDSEVRVFFKGGQYRWHLLQYNPLKDESGQIIRWYATATDIDDRKRAEEKLRQSEENLRTITDTIRQPIVVLAPDGTTIYANRVALDITGLTIDDVKSEGFSVRAFHPDDLNRLRDERRAGLLEGVPFDLQMRVLFKEGQYRWHLVQYNPLRDESGQIIRWYVTATNIDEQKSTEERLRNENLVLREEIDRSSMFEEIVGSSSPIRQLLKKVEKVAPSDSTVLILGETGTGKELIARALHRRSKRANRAFVRVNCAAIPQSLIASELFGHEKGAFTGALQRRVGRFEAANGGTLFLDEIGELPMDTQIALLRVLQEREFERVGSNHPISVDVRLIAATNRDLPDAVAAGTFRQDLFYRLNVFPMGVPPLRERSEDIPLLVEYFVGRFAKDAGKNILHIGKHTLEQLQSYDWPGNIRELQNVVERAVVLCETDTFVVDESWLKSEPSESTSHEGLSVLDDREVEMIQAALAETHGRISGPSGAAAKLGIPRQTLESKIRRLGIDKYGQKRPTSR